MVDIVEKYQLLHGWYVGRYSFISLDNEILHIFFKHFDIIVKWINCNYTWGVYDEETERWTGAVGKVEMKTFFQS